MTLDRAGALCARRLIVLLLCVAGTSVIYAPALSGGVVWDDAYLVGENPFFKSPVFSLEVFRHWLFFDSFSTYYRPVQNWSYMLDYWLWRGNTVGYHLTNIGLHAAAGFLLYLLLRRLLPTFLDAARPTISIVSALIALTWTVHPVHNAAVAYISGRADSLAAVLALLAWLMALTAQEAPGARGKSMWGGAAMLAMLGALCAKEIALVWLALFLSHQWWKGARTMRGKIAVTLVALAVLGIYAGLHSLPAYRAPMEDAPPAPLDARLLLMLRALGDYTGLMFFPAKLYMERAISDVAAYQSAASWRTHTHGEWLSVFGLLALIGASAACAWRAPGRPLRIAGAAWFAIAFLPISNLFPLNAEVAEHWIYLASIGFIALLAGIVLAFPSRWQRWACAAAMLAIVSLGARTAVRSGDWADAETFCRRTIEAGGATPRILSTLSAIYAKRGEWAKEELVLRKTIERFPEFAPARIQLGISLAKQGRPAEAAQLLELAASAVDETARRFPRTWPAALNLAKLRADAGDAAAALALLGEARNRFPESWEIVRYRGTLLRDAEGARAELREVERFAAGHWWHLDSWLTLGRLRAAGGDPEGAIAAFEQAGRLDLYDGRPLAGIAQVELSRHRTEAALTAQCAAIARDPERPAHYVELGEILEQLGRGAEANGALRKAQMLIAKAGGPS
ncbi:MAG TPA: tetratricopeptide repeat protein [Chthoniobacteraceae bacterium]|nr:tetratricopeptide repeat protein [Chthoniobacteraceae bacterium]